ncbi:MAG: carbohydrate-binding protein [Steroidobacteraceae bacterium]
MTRAPQRRYGAAGRYAGAALLAAGAGWLLAHAAVAAVPAARRGVVAVTVTTDGGRRRLQPGRAVRWRRMPPGPRTVWIDDARRYQTVVGFGAAWTDSAAYLLNEVARPEARERALRELFTRRDGGIGLSFMRVPLGASDLARTRYSYDERPPGEADPTLAHFSIAHDRRDLIPLIRAALRLNPKLRLMASPWSPPGWMKTSGSMIGGSLLPQYARTFAAYLVKFLLAYRRAGIGVEYLTLQNEPRYLPSNYPGMRMSAREQRRLLVHDVLPALAAAHLATRVLLYDHNWDHPQYPDTVLASPVLADSPRIAGIAWHGYGGTPGVQSLLAAKYPRLGQYETELSGGTWVHDQVRSDFETIIEVLRNQGRTFVKWSLALDQHLGPHDGGCGTCTPLVTVDTRTGAVRRDVEYATLGQFSRFILPGARRVYSSDPAGIESVALINPDGTHVLVAFNDTARRNTVQIEWGARGVRYALPAYSGATFTWSGTAQGTSALPARAYQSAGSLAQSGGPDRAADLYSWGVVTQEHRGARGGYALERAVEGDWALYPALDFGEGVHRVRVRVACGRRACGTLQFRLDSPHGRLIAQVPIVSSGGWQRFATVTGRARGARGEHDLYVVWRGAPGRLATLLSFHF